MKRDNYGRFISNKTEIAEKGKPKRDAKGRFLPKESALRVLKKDDIEALQKEANDQLVRIHASSEEMHNQLMKKFDDGFSASNEIPTRLPDAPTLSEFPELPKINLPKYTIDDIKKAFIAGLNDSQGILPLSKRFEMYCKKSGINL
jgi:hypothetical protein